jgi:glycosyltransferase involved in cell wall biosynthesis
MDWRRRPAFQRNAWGHFGRVLAFCNRDAAAIAELAPEVAARVRVSPFGLELPRAADPAREQTGVLLFTGNFTHFPNRDAAAWLANEIMPIVRERQPGAHLRIVGSQPPPETLDLTGPGVDVFPDPPSIEPHMEEASVVVAPVRTGGGMRMKVLQALAAGKAVVTTQRGSEGFDCFGAAPPLRVADTVEGFAEETATLLRDSLHRGELGRRARTFAERHHSPTAWAARLEAVYEDARREREAPNDG